MKRLLKQFRGRVAGEDGQALPWMVSLAVLVVSFGGITVDAGRAYVSQRQLQASTDAAAMAAAYTMSLPSATASGVKSSASSLSVASGSGNQNTTFSSVSMTTTLQCLSTVSNWGVSCSSSPTGDNAVQVVQTGTISTWFIRILSTIGINSANSLTLSAESTASMRGATNQQYNIAVVIDTTHSMSSADTDANCGSTRITCALQGVQTLLGSLSPCTVASASSTCVPFDQVALFTFPNVQANVSSDKTSEVTQDTTCPTSNPTIPSYSTPAAGATWSQPTTGSATYQVTGFVSNYSSNNLANGGLNTGSSLAVASGAKSGCQGLQTPGGDGTYLAGAVYAAQSALVAAQAKNPGSANAMVVLSDGAANTTKMTGGAHNGNTYPSLDYQCQQSITAAQYASNHGTTVYTVAYGASTAGAASQCTTDPTLSPCSELQQMATSASTFYSDATASQNAGQCTSSANPNLTLNQIFKAIWLNTTVARLIPNGTT